MKNEMTDTDWEKLAQKYDFELKNKSRKRTYLEDIKFETSWYLSEYIVQPYRSIKNGIKNYWKYRKIIWEDHWWDHMYLQNIIEFKLQDMYNNWDKSYSCNSDDLKTEIKVLIDILQLINEKEDDCSGEVEDWHRREKEIDLLYQRFGERLFSIREFKRKDCDGKEEDTYETNLFRQLWD
jgi:hypothetical protein